MKIVDWFQSLPAFLRDVRLEVKKTSFPSRNEVVNTTLVVIVVVIIFGVFLWAVDQVIFSLLNRLFSLFH
ncbi:MAG: preprotein translocase subunit SecE [Acidobacteriota bacterium]